MTTDISQPDTDQTGPQPAPTKYQPLRIWPPVVLIGLMLVARAFPALVKDGPPTLWMVSAFGPLVCGALVILWWLILSRATAAERVVGLVGILVTVGLTVATVDKTMKGPAIILVTIPMGTAAFALGSILFGRVLAFRRTLVAVFLAGLAFGFSGLLRSEGMWGESAKLDLHWRFVQSAEQKMLAARASEPATSPAAELDPAQITEWLRNPEWPAFRGVDRSGAYRGDLTFADWSGAGPEELWRVAVGPGWSSFSVAGNLLFTQEQRGEQEAVVCFRADTGEQVWDHEITSRFDDPLGGPGPRATPTLHNGAVYALGARGDLMRLNAATGELVWQEDLKITADREPPIWGFCSSPLVVGDTVIVHAGGKDDKGTLAFALSNGELRWSAPAGAHSYSSAQICTIDGSDYIVMLTDAGADLLNPATGETVLNYEWKHEGYRVLQPYVVNGNCLIIATGMGAGTRCVKFTSGEQGLTTEDLWTTKTLKPDFNDLVVHEGHAYGFDGAVFTCIDLETGDRKWKGGRYGKGQVLLLKSSGLLLVAAEKGDLVMLKADPSGHNELSRLPGLSGRTWNHPVVIGDRLYIRNSEEAACLRLPVEEQSEVPL